MTRIAIRDVTLRDGLQDEDPIPTATKVAIFEGLVAAGVTDLELTSFVRSDRVPAMADAAELAAATAGSPVTRWALALNARGAERALAAGLTHLQYVISVSPEHSKANAGRSPAEALDGLRSVLDLAGDEATVELTAATAFGCPYRGPVGAELVAAVVDPAVEAGVSAVSLADTIGTAIPVEVSAAVGRVRADHPDLPVGVHLHDTRGLGVANALAAIEAGARRLDATVGGLGGCPFAPGASGNVAAEDLVHVLEESGHDTGIDLAALLDVARLVADAVGRPLESHVGRAGPRFRTIIG